MNKNSKNILLGAGIFSVGVAALTAATYGITKRLVKIALDPKAVKETEKSERLISGNSRAPEELEFLAEYSEKLKNCGAETVETESHDGKKLIGHYYECENPQRIIIAMHGWRSSWTRDFGVISEFWHNNNCNVLYADQRGQGNSDGEYMSFGLTERFDCLDWVNWVGENCKCDLPIYLAGISMGATTVLMATGLDLPDSVHGVMADCGFTSPNDIWRHVAQQNLHIPYGNITESIANGICKKTIQVGSKDYSSIEALRNAKVPVLFVHGTDDHFVPVEMTYENYKACASPKRLLIVPGAEHGMSYLIDPKSYKRAVKEFWQDFD